MKQFFVLLTIVSMLFATAFDAEARKKFGSKKKGKTHQTSTVQQKKQVDTKSLAAQQGAKKKSSKKGIMAGVLGGLLAGGLIAAMMGDDFEGFQFLEMILLAIAAFVLFKVIMGFMRKRQQPQMAGAPNFAQQQPQQNQSFSQPQQFQANQTAGGFGAQQEVPFNLPRDFDVNGFLQGARSHYQTIQTAWNNRDYTTMAEYLSPELVEEFRQEREQQGDVATEVMFVDAELARADVGADKWEISVMFRGKYRDQGDMQEEPIHEVWHLERKTQGDAPWLIVGVEDLIES
ncbi:Tim44 domain-containing protein [Pseudoalteromonas luteoviolacea]|uniref:Tim44 domain-containing protein n=1 Tax=Pseudoalteromonas luteoviolacea TaxID=43657 RepID=UPI001B3A5886|nr:Tim44-like domain-containing protein [Pseudoalteromonas luteoviolacea]MBQ4876548.1 Tim44 domain-containing protein [Pseudoalteromonas luteoviolacea]MBQ4905179.1 Tim44 domain-containing protein [Pseudoalteromonas luteoviolacea]